VKSANGIYRESLKAIELTIETNKKGPIKIMTIDIETISSNLVKVDDGIWYSADDGNISYPADGNNACFL
jgi:hypothetical protein